LWFRLAADPAFGALKQVWIGLAGGLTFTRRYRNVEVKGLDGTSVPFSIVRHARGQMVVVLARARLGVQVRIASPVLQATDRFKSAVARRKTEPIQLQLSASGLSGAPKQITVTLHPR
jgi:hypothetical protein